MSTSKQSTCKFYPKTKTSFVFNMASIMTAKTIHIKTASTWKVLIVLGFNDTSTLVGHFVSSPREREKSDRRDSRRD